MHIFVSTQKTQRSEKYKATKPNEKGKIISQYELQFQWDTVYSNMTCHVELTAHRVLELGGICTIT